MFFKFFSLYLYRWRKGHCSEGVNRFGGVKADRKRGVQRSGDRVGRVERD